MANNLYSSEWGCTVWGYTWRNGNGNGDPSFLSQLKYRSNAQTLIFISLRFEDY